MIASNIDFGTEYSAISLGVGSYSVENTEFLSRQAAPFVISGLYLLDSVETLLVNATSENLRFTIHANDNNKPGAVLGWVDQMVTANLAAPLVEVNFTSAGLFRRRRA